MLQVWPDLGLHHAAIAKIAALIDRPARAAPAARKALEILCLTHGGGGEVVRELSQLLRDCVERCR
jgi:hypothetical protein